MKKYLMKNKYIILFLTIISILYIYCALQGFAINDDLPYSLFYRGTERVTTIKQIILNQMSDYLTINGRFFVHCVVQFVLMFNRNLFAILNSLLLVLTFIFTKKSIVFLLQKNNVKKQFDDIYIYFFIVGLFLLLGSFKYLIYWVAGSVNYIWIYSLLSIFLYYYLKNGLLKHKVINSLIFLFISAIHECSFVFIVLIIIGDFIKNLLENKKDKKIYIYLFYLLISIIGGLFVIKSPGNTARMATSTYFYSMSFVNKLNLTLPIVSKNLFCLFNFDNLIPTIYILCFGLVLMLDEKISFKYLGILLLFSSIVCHLLAIGWLYFILSIIVFIISIIYNYKKKYNILSVILLSMYAVVFSMAITPEFGGARPNYYMFVFMILLIVFYLNIVIKNRLGLKCFKILSVILIVVTVFNEFNIYYNIGIVKKERLKQIDIVKKEKLEVLKYKKISKKFQKYYPDANCPDSNAYWAFKYFIYYYDLPEDITIELID